jgi:hypothetical protein
MNGGSTRDKTVSLARLLEVSDQGVSPWTSHELGDILEHQLIAPLAPDLETIEGGPAAMRRATDDGHGPPICTFRDLFSHPNPPEDLLDLVKRFAKQCRRQPESPLPDEIATILYFLAIVVARLRRGRRISGLDDQSLDAGLHWALDQSWLDNVTRAVLQDGLASLLP